MSAATIPHAESWAALRASETPPRVRDAAMRFGCTEAELVAAGAADGVVRLRPDWSALLHGVSAAGPVMALTRNEDCVHERHGRYEDIRLEGHVGLVLGPDIDLRLFLREWQHAFFVPAGLPGSPRGSIQVFDGAGTAVHKIFTTDATDPHALPALAATLAEPHRPVDPVKAGPKVERPDEEIDIDRLRSSWRALRDMHDFFPLLRRLKLGRRQALRLAGEEFATPVGRDAIGTALTRAAGAALPVMVFVGNPGCIQIHTGPVANLKVLGPWFNVLDPSFNLHLRQTGIDGVWLVRKPTDDGPVTSLEAFDTAGRLILTLFGRRKPGVPEDPAWRVLAEGMAA